MPILLTIKDNSEKDNRQPGDVVGVYPDGRPITKKEQQLYTITEITDEQAAEYNALSEKEKTVFKASSADWSFDFPSSARVWQDDEGDWHEITKMPVANKRFIDGKFELNYDREPGNKSKTLIQGSGKGQGK